jgi:hypothetical protein
MVVQAAPAPEGHDQILRRLIEDTAKGQIQYQTLEPALADAIRPQAATAQAELLALGALKAVTLRSDGANGVEVYRTSFKHGALDWAFGVDAQGLISNARYRTVAAD